MKIFTANGQNIKEAIGIQVTFIKEKNLQREDFIAKFDYFFGNLWVHFELLLRWERAYVCHHQKSKIEII